MAQIGEIATVVTAKTAPFSRGMRRAKGEARQFGRTAKTSIAGTLRKSVGPALTKVTGFLTGPGGIIAAFASAAVAGRRFIGMMGEQAEKLDEIGKTASRLNIGTGELAALEFAGQQTGVSFGELQKGLEKFNKRIGLAVQGSGEAAGMLEMMGIDAQKFIKIPISDRLAIIAGRIEKAGTAAEKAAIADRFFGRAGASSLLNLLQQGDEGIRKLTETAWTLGIAMEDNVVASIEQANDTMNRFGNQAEGLKKQITGDLWPALGLMLEDLERFQQKTGMLEGDKERTTGQKLVDLVTRDIPQGFTKAAGKMPFMSTKAAMGLLSASTRVPRTFIDRARARQEQLKYEQPLPGYEKYRGSRKDRQDRLMEMQLKAQQKMALEQRRTREMFERARQSQPRTPTVDHF